jgi:prlF antitoxin for toxin YhaV_toxin
LGDALPDTKPAPERHAQPVPTEDECVAAFLDLLACEMEKNPQRVQPLDPALLRRVRELTRGLVVDLDAPLNPLSE